MSDCEPIDLSGLCNAGLAILAGSRQPAVGEQMFHGLPFLIGDPKDPGAACFIALEPETAMTVPVHRPADHVIVAHRRLPGPGGDGIRAGSAVAEYAFTLAGQQEPGLAVPIRERFEIAVAPEEGWDASGPFLAGSSAQLRLADRYQGRWEDLGMRQCEAVFAGLADYFLWTWENPRPAVPVESVRLAALGGRVLVAAITAGSAGEFPFPLEAGRTIKITALGRSGPEPLTEPAVLVDRGVASYAFRLQGSRPEGGSANDRPPGWGEPDDPASPHAYARVEAVPSVTVIVADGEREIGRFRWRDLAPAGLSSSRA